LLASPFKSNSRLEAENAALRHQLIVLQRKVRGRVQFTHNDRLFFVQLYRWFPSILKAMTIIRPETLVRWHRAGFRRYWRWKSRNLGGRPRIDAGLRALIRRMSVENLLWGAPRIHGELFKLGFAVAQSTVAKYMVRAGGTPSGQGWGSFLRNHMPQIAAMDLFVVPTIGFKLLYALVIVRLARREILWINVTAQPTAEWIAQQITEAFPWHEAPRYLIRDRDAIYNAAVTRRLRAMGIRDKPIARGSPWQNGFAERLIGSIRRECVDHVVALGEQHLRKVLKSYANYYNDESYCLSLYVIDSKRLGTRYFGPVGCDRRLRTRSTRRLVSSRSRIARLKSQGPSARGWVAWISPCSAATRNVFGLMPSRAAAWVRFIHPSASQVSDRYTGIPW
jgi:transposase InsO family protein